MTGLHGILLVDKEQGWTSHDVVAKARGLTHQRKIGHTGTLDPMATGLLVLCLGDATRFVEYMTGHDKRYDAAMVLGATTDTDDAEGTVISRRPVPSLDPATLRQLEQQFTGILSQRPPAFSAVKVGGQRAYAAARAGRQLELAERPVTVHAIQLEQADADQLQMTVHCGSGTYIRSLARDIGAALGCGGHVTALRRMSAGRFDVAAAVTIDTVAKACSEDWFEDLLLSADEGVADTDAAIITIDHGEEFRQGRAIRYAETALETPEPIRIYDGAGSFLGIGRCTAEGELRPIKVLAGR